MSVADGVLHQLVADRRAGTGPAAAPQAGHEAHHGRAQDEEDQDGENG
jgi:hypothetical protein